MDDVLANLSPTKRNNIINSALEEFTNNEFHKASTNNIVKKAGISKGLLFHYFKTKQDLYDYLISFVTTNIIYTVYGHLNWKQSDIIERIKNIVVIKMDLLNKHPHISKFGAKLIQIGLKDDLKKIIEEEIPNLYAEVYTKNIDFSLFKEEIDVQKSIKMIEATLEKVSEEWMLVHRFSIEDNNYDGLIAEINDYLKTFKKLFYK